MNLYNYKALVSNVVDGDTVDAFIDLGFRMHAEMRLRLLGIDTPEMNAKDPLERIRALEAKEFVRTKVLGKQVLVHTEKADSFGRYLADIWYDEGGIQKSLTAALVEQGYSPYKPA